MSKFKKSLPVESRQEFTATFEEGKAVAKTSLQAALDAADSATYTIYSSCLGNWLIESLQGSHRDTSQTGMSNVDILGLHLNVPKWTVFLTQRMEFIDAVLESGRATASLPESRFKVMDAIIRDLSYFPTTMATVFLRLLGHMASCTYVAQHARLQLRPLQTWLASVYHPNRDKLDKVVSLPLWVINSLQWVGAGLCGSSLFQTTAIAIPNDGCIRNGWGEHLGSLRTQGLCSQEKLSLHIKVRELRAVQLASQAF